MILEIIVLSITYMAWMLSMEVAREKSWSVLDLSKLNNLLYPVLSFIALGIILVMIRSNLHNFKYSIDMMFAPFVVVPYYLIHIILLYRHRETRKEIWQFDQWNLMVLLTSTILAVTVMFIS